MFVVDHLDSDEVKFALKFFGQLLIFKDLGVELSTL